MKVHCVYGFLYLYNKSLLDTDRFKLIRNDLGKVCFFIQSTKTIRLQSMIYFLPKTQISRVKHTYNMQTTFVIRKS